MQAIDPGLKNTLIVATADHDHTLLINGYSPRTGKTTPTNPGILGLVRSIPDGKIRLDKDGAPFTILGFGTGEHRVQGSRKDVKLTDEIAAGDDYHQEAVVRTRAGRRNPWRRRRLPGRHRRQRGTVPRHHRQHPRFQPDQDRGGPVSYMTTYAARKHHMTNLRLSALLVAACFSANANAAPPAAKPQAKNIIFFLGDGMGPTTITAARIFKAGEDGLLDFERLDRTARIKTYSADAQVTDSAPSMGAYMTGVKINNDVISLKDAKPVAPGKDAQRHSECRPLRREQRHARR